jgi:transcriptional regulator with XRE-family HTH domain
MAADRFRRIRREAGLSQVEFAVGVGCSRAHVARVENGRGEYRYSELLAMAELTGLPIADLMLPATVAAPAWLADYQRLQDDQRERVDRVMEAALELVSCQSELPK